MPRVATVLVPLPVTYNPDYRGQRRLIPWTKFQRTMEEVAALFGGGTLHRFERDAPRGFWWDRGIVDADTHAIPEVNFEDSRSNRARFARYARATLLDRFRQKAVYVKFIGPIETLTIRHRTVRKRT